MYRQGRVNDRVIHSNAQTTKIRMQLGRYPICKPGVFKRYLDNEPSPSTLSQRVRDIVLHYSHKKGL